MPLADELEPVFHFVIRDRTAVRGRAHAEGLNPACPARLLWGYSGPSMNTLRLKPGPRMSEAVIYGNWRTWLGRSLPAKPQ